LTVGGKPVRAKMLQMTRRVFAWGSVMPSVFFLLMAHLHTNVEIYGLMNIRSIGATPQKPTYCGLGCGSGITKIVTLAARTLSHARQNRIPRPPCTPSIRTGLNQRMASNMTIEQTLPQLLLPQHRALEIATLVATAIARVDASLKATQPGRCEISLGLVAPARLHTNPSQPRSL
jgi:hypothetical protein